MKQVLFCINSFFFDVEDHPENDWISAIIFYGSILGSMFVAVGIWFI